MTNVTKTVVNIYVNALKEAIERKHEEDPENCPTFEECIEELARRTIDKYGKKGES